MVYELKCGAIVCAVTMSSLNMPKGLSSLDIYSLRLMVSAMIHIEFYLVFIVN